MISWIFYHIPFAEPATRWLLYRLPNLKQKIKKNKKSVATPKAEFDKEAWEQYKAAVSAEVKDNDILLIHASMDGLRNLGIDEEEMFSFLKSFVEKGCTIVCTAFPITNLKDKDHKMKVYKPDTTPCWTGMLSNRFISEPEAIRSAVPYNSLAAIGPKAEEMMADNLQADYVYGEHTPWRYCVDNHAKILFLGTTSVDSNTIQTHMMADYMGENWPIENWYEEFECPIKIDGEKIEKTMYIQSVYWTQYVMDYYTTSKLEKHGYLKKYSIKDCPFEVVEDAYDMVKYLEAECLKGKLTYLIPKKYWRNR